MNVQAQQIVGILTSCQIYNARWGRGIVRLDDGDQCIVTGETLVGLTEGNRYRMHGSLVQHPRYGAQFACDLATIDIPLDDDALVHHLRRNFKGCGEVTARKIVARYHSDLAALRDQLVTNPYALDFSAVTKRKVSVSGAGDLGSLIYRDLSIRIGMAGVRDNILRKLADWLLNRVQAKPEPIAAGWSLFSRDPYAPIQDIDGYGFAAADHIALRAIGFPRFDDARLAALATHALRDGCERGGHVFLGLDDIAERIAVVDPDVSPARAMAAAKARKAPIVTDGERYYPRHLWIAERALAKRFALRALTMAEPIFHQPLQALEEEIATAEEMLSQDGPPFKLDGSQRKAILGILTSTHLVHTLTAGPGCGKTALMEVLAHVARDRRILFCAPTGKAAKVLSARVKRFGFAATTIHAMLGAMADGFQFNEHNPLDAEIIVADETSMDDLMLTRALMEAAAPDAHVIFLGDMDQLPSVGPGQILKDLLQMPFDHHRLTDTWRNDGGILDVVKQAGLGIVDCERRPDVAFSRRLPEPDDVGISRVVQAYLKAVEQFGMPRVGLLMPRRKGDVHIPGWNTTYLNELLRQHLNPDGQRVVGTTLRIGDRIIIRKNLQIDLGDAPDGSKLTEQIVNGDTGFIADCRIDHAGRNVIELDLALDDGRRIRFPGKDVESIGLAYALTVHAAQGSEYDVVIFVCTNGSPGFVHRGIVYTAFSRARKKLWVLSDDRVLRSIAERAIPARNSELVSRMRTAMRRIQKAGGRSGGYRNNPGRQCRA
jgi:exodeoxyribonuclease V alpha subunit